MKRHGVRLLADAGHKQTDIRELTGVPERSIRRIQNENAPIDFDDRAEHDRRKLGRPNAVDGFRKLVQELLGEDPNLKTLEILRRCKNQGYAGGKSQPAFRVS